jgi:hypothetical protein
VLTKVKKNRKEFAFYSLLVRRNGDERLFEAVSASGGRWKILHRLAQK